MIKSFLKNNTAVVFGIPALYYLITTGLILPLYLPSYNTLGTDKAFFWKTNLKITLCLFAVSAVLYAVSLIVRLIAKEAPIFQVSSFSELKKTILPHEIWTVLFAICACVSYMLSARKDIARIGETGWYIGAWQYVAMCLCVLVIGRTVMNGSLFTGTLLISSFLVYEAGIVIDLVGKNLNIEGWDVSKMSTIGNGNWFCGYLVCVLFVPAAVYMTAGNKSSKNSDAVKVFCLVHFFVSAYCFFSQGSASAYPATLAVFIILLIHAGREMDKLINIAELTVSFAAGGLFHAVAVKAGVYERANDSVTKFLDGPVFLLFLLAASVIIMLVLRKKRDAGCKTINVHIGRIAAIALGSLLAVYILTVVVNTACGGFLGTGPVFYFGEKWASSRGMTITAGLKLFGGMTFKEKIFGIGPDVFYSLIYSGRFPALAEKMTEYFGGARLTNAHCEPVTMLVNTGLAGTVCFYGMLVSLFKETFGAAGRKLSVKVSDKGYRAAVLAAALGIAAYMINNIFSFQTAMNLSQLSLLAGFGASAVRGLSETEDK